MSYIVILMSFRASSIKYDVTSQQYNNIDRLLIQVCSLNASKNDFIPEFMKLYKQDPESYTKLARNSGRSLIVGSI